MNTDKVHIGRRVQAALDETGLKKKDLAAALGVSPGSVSGYCSGSTEPSGASLATIARLCNVNLHWLITGDGDKSPSLRQDKPRAWPEQDRRAAPRVAEGDACYLKGTVHLSNTELRLLASFRELDTGQQGNIIGIAEAFRVANESRENVGGGSISAEQKSA